MVRCNYFICNLKKQPDQLIMKLSMSCSIENILFSLYFCFYLYSFFEWKVVMSQLTRRKESEIGKTGG